MVISSYKSDFYGTQLNNQTDRLDSLFESWTNFFDEIILRNPFNMYQVIPIMWQYWF